MKKIDLTGKTFGRLLVVAESDKIVTQNGRSHISWLCKCTCGNEIVVRGDCLRNGHTVSCGCKRKEILNQAGKNRVENLVGNIYGKLKVIQDSGNRDSSGGVIWECKCECGNIVYVSASNLTRKKEPTVSCGCAKSKGELKIIDILNELNINFITQKRFSDCIYPDTSRQLVFDFYLLDYNMLIEYDGEQHFHITKNDRFNYEELNKRDRFKNEWCNKNNIPLIRIPYTDYNQLNAENMRRIIQRNGWTEVR